MDFVKAHVIALLGKIVVVQVLVDSYISVKSYKLINIKYIYIYIWSSPNLALKAHAFASVAEPGPLKVPD